jgi:hypothetical protein
MAQYHVFCLSQDRKWHSRDQLDPFKGSKLKVGFTSNVYDPRLVGIR